MVFVGVTLLGFGLACGGDVGGGGSAASTAPAHGSIAFQTYSSGRMWLKFDTDTKVVLTWKNMVGGPVPGTYTHQGDEVLITFPPEIENTGFLEWKLRQMDECSLARYYTRNKEGEEKEEALVFNRTQPKCR